MKTTVIKAEDGREVTIVHNKDWTQYAALRTGPEGIWDLPAWVVRALMEQTENAQDVGQKAAEIEALEQQVHELSHDKACDEILVRDQNDTIRYLRSRIAKLEVVVAAARNVFDSEHKALRALDEDSEGGDHAPSPVTPGTVSGGSGERLNARQSDAGDTPPLEPAGSSSTCWHCLDVVLGHVPRCESCPRPGECDVDGCGEPGCEKPAPAPEPSSLMAEVNGGYCPTCGLLLRLCGGLCGAQVRVHKLTDLVSREQLIEACKKAASAGDARSLLAFEAFAKALEKP